MVDKEGGEKEKSREEVGKGMHWQSHQAEPQRWEKEGKVEGGLQEKASEGALLRHVVRHHGILCPARRRQRPRNEGFFHQLVDACHPLRAVGLQPLGVGVSGGQLPADHWPPGLSLRIFLCLPVLHIRHAVEGVL